MPSPVVQALLYHCRASSTRDIIIAPRLPSSLDSWELRISMTRQLVVHHLPTSPMIHVHCHFLHSTTVTIAFVVDTLSAAVIQNGLQLY